MQCKDPGSIVGTDVSYSRAFVCFLYQFPVGLWGLGNCKHSEAGSKRCHYRGCGFSHICTFYPRHTDSRWLSRCLFFSCPEFNSGTSDIVVVFPSSDLSNVAFPLHINMTFLLSSLGAYLSLAHSVCRSWVNGCLLPLLQRNFFQSGGFFLLGPPMMNFGHTPRLPRSLDFTEYC